MTIEKAEIIISTLLRAGVTVSLAVVVLGTVLTFIHHPTYLTNPEDLAQLTRWGGETPQSLRALFAGILALRGKPIIMFGLLLLIATPVFRVAVSVVIFLIQKDRTYVLLTLIVLALLLTSFLLGTAT
jgi:uncharacterized membrane protein